LNRRCEFVCLHRRAPPTPTNLPRNGNWFKMVAHREVARVWA
jgi:hypothetical protein